jgi:hypothetical protein
MFSLLEEQSPGWAISTCLCFALCFAYCLHPGPCGGVTQQGGQPCDDSINQRLGEMKTVPLNVLERQDLELSSLAGDKQGRDDHKGLPPTHPSKKKIAESLNSV